MSIHWSGKSLWENGKENVPEDSGGYTFSEREYLQEFSITAETRIEDLQKIILFLEECCQTDDIVFVHGRGKRKKQKPMVLFFFRGVFSAPFLGYVVYGGGGGNLEKDVRGFCIVYVWRIRNG